MPFTFSAETLSRPLAEFGNDSAQMILQAGATIQDGLQKMMTNRQVAGLGQELGALNPESPEWAQKAVQLGSRYPLAMKAPAGQFMLSTQAKAHAEWAQAQRATQQADSMMKRQVGMENLRTQNDIKLEEIRQRGRMTRSGDELVPLDGVAMPVERNPAQGINFQGPTQSGEPLGATPPVDEPGMSGLLPDISGREMSPAQRAKAALSELGPAASRKSLERLTIQNVGADERKALTKSQQEAITARKKMDIDLRAEALDLAQETAAIKQDFQERKFDFTKLTQKVSTLKNKRDTMFKAFEASRKAGRIEEAEAQFKIVGAYDAARDELLGLGKEPKTEYVKGKRYGGMEFLGGDPKDQNNWRK